MRLYNIYKYFLFVCFIILLTGCNKNAFFDPYAFAPKHMQSKWSPVNSDKIITSKYCQPLFPKEYSEDNKLTLAELIDIALMNNPDTKKSWAEARSAAALYGQSLSPYLPEINADASYTRERQTYLDTSHQVTGGKKHKAFYRTEVEPEVTLSYLIYDFGQRKSSSASAKQALYYADWMHNRSLQDVMQSVMVLYYNYQYQKKALIALNEDLFNAETSLDAATQKFAAGLASVGDVVQAKTKYLETKINLVKKENDKELSYAKLLNAIGITSNSKLKIENLPDNSDIAFVLDNLDHLVNKAEILRQDFLAAEANLKKSEEDLNYAKALSKPTITSEFEIGRNYYDKGIHEDYHFAAEFKLNIPIFKGLYFRNGIKSAEAKLLYARALLEQTKLEITKEVTEARSNVISASQTKEYSGEYLLEAKKQFDIALANYKAGTNTILDVISAQSSLADARAQNAKAHTDWFSSIATLTYSTGALCFPEQNNAGHDNEYPCKY